MQFENALRNQFTEAEISAIERTIVKDRRHPLKRLLCPSDRDSQVLTNTNRALERVLKTRQNWFESKKGDLLETTDYSTSSATIGELRAYGMLLEGMTGTVDAIRGHGETSPDFAVHDCNQKVVIEVHSKQYESHESISLEEFNNAEVDYPLPGETTVREHEIVPFGTPKKGENVTENVISKLTAVKQDENQFSTKEPSLLWIDFQDELWDMALKFDSTLPIRTWNGQLYSGEIWYAMYGFEGAPIFEGETTELRSVRNIIRMRHNGRFRLKTKIDAVVFSFPRSTIVLENPYTEKQVPDWFWKQFMHIPWFQYEYSWLNWPDNNLVKSIKIEIEKIRSLDSLQLYRW